MSNLTKHAYMEGVKKALSDYGLLKAANLQHVANNIESGMTPEEAWEAAYPGEPVPDNLEELLSAAE